MEGPSNEDFDLARNFGFDITMSGGNMGMPAAAHKEYLMQCNFLYKEFLSNMNILLKEEELVKKTLKELYAEKIKNMKFSLYRCQNDNNHDPFARKKEPPPLSPSVWESRGNTPWESRDNTPCVPRGLDPITDEDDSAFRPQTAPAGQGAGNIDGDKDITLLESRPKTTGALKKHVNNEEVTEKEPSVISIHSEIVGMLDPELEKTSNRKITVSKHSFATVVRPTKISIKNREGQFLIKPMKGNFVQEETDIVAYDPANTYRHYDPMNEKLALVRRITSYKTPTIASDMKINNRVPIQKSLRGENAKRVSVAEIFQNARDRKTRHFKIVARNTSKDYTKEEVIERIEKKILTVDSKPFSRADMKPPMNGVEFRTRSRANTRLCFKENTSLENEETDPASAEILAASANSGRFGSVLKRFRTVDTVECQAGRGTRQDNAENQSPRRNELLRGHSSDRKSHDKYDHSYKSDEEKKEKRSGSSSMIRRKRPQRRISEMTAATEISEAYKNGGKQDIVPAVATSGRGRNSVLSLAVPLGGRQSITPEASELLNMKTPVKNNKKGNLETGSKISSIPQAKVKSMIDTSRIVKQQMRKDKVLDERMAVWKRRMVNAGITTDRGMINPIKRGSKLRLI